MPQKTSKPEDLPVKIDLGRITNDLAAAEYALGVLEGSQKKLQNPSLLIAPLTAKEAAVSSKIEGTQSTASDIFVYEASGHLDKSDTAEVANYRKAMLYAIGELQDRRPFSPNLIKRLHHLLLDGVRHHGAIGKFREVQVWIAERQGDPIDKAIYVAPEAIHVPGYISNMFDYILKSDDRLLVKAGIVHYQFEAIHPFEDGNGRIGRLIIPLLLYYRSKLTLPIIYLSGYFESNRDAYIKSLHAVDENHSYEEWLSFFLKAITSQAEQTQKLVEQIYALYDTMRDAYSKLKSPYIIPLIECMFANPVFSISDLIKATEATRLTCTSLLRLLITNGYVAQLSIKSGRQKLYAFKNLLRIIR